MKTVLAGLVGGVLVTATGLFAASADTNSADADFYRTAINTNSGRYAVVDSRKEVVTLFDETGQVIWRTNVVAGLQPVPVMGERKIHGMQVYLGDLWVNVGRGYGVVDIKTGWLKGFAQN